VLTSLVLALAPLVPLVGIQAQAPLQGFPGVAPGSALASARFQRFEGGAPFQLWLEQAAPADPVADRAFVEAHGPWLSELARLWEAEYTAPLKLERPARAAELPVYVLRTQESFVQHFAKRPSLAPYAPYVRFDAEAGTLVTFGGGKQTQDRAFLRRAILHVAVEQLLAAWSSTPEDSWPPWLALGLAQYLSAHRGSQPAALAAHPLDRDALKNVGNLVRLDQGLDVFLPPIDELVASADLAAALAHLRARAGAAKPRPGDGHEYAPWYVQSHASLLVWFLHLGESGKHRSALLEVLDRGLRGKRGPEVFRSAFGSELAPLEGAFRRWLQPALWNETGLNLPISTEPRRLVPTPSAPAQRKVDVAALAPDEHDPESLFAGVLVQARSGAVEGAARRLRAALDGFDANLRARAERELVRLEAFAERRRAFFAVLAAPGARKLEFGQGTARILAQVTGVDERAARLGENKRGLTELVLEELDMLELAEAMRDKKYAFDAGSSVGYAFALCQDERWKKVLPAGDPSASELRADAERDLPARFALARALELLDQLARAGLPADAEAAALTLARIEELCRTHLARPQVARQRETLLELARATLELRFAADGLASRLSGRVEALPDGRFRFTYAFELPAELVDWQQTGYLESHAFERAREDFRIDAGRLVTQGFASLRHLLTFEGPQLVRLRYRYSRPAGEHDPRFLLLLGLNDDGQVSYAATDSSGALYVQDRASGHVREAEGGSGIVIGEGYTLELAFDGQNYASNFNGHELATASAGPRVSGNPILFTTADFPFQAEELVLEGKPTTASLVPLSTAWVEERLRALGL